MEFVLKIVRNAFILSGMLFVSTWATGDLSYELCKPIIIFFLGYIFTELGRYYKLPTSKKGAKPLIWSIENDKRK